MHDLVWVLSHSVQLARGCLILLLWGLVLFVLSACLFFSWGASRFSAARLGEIAAPPIVMVAPAAAALRLSVLGYVDVTGGAAWV